MNLHEIEPTDCAQVLFLRWYHPDYDFRQDGNQILYRKRGHTGRESTYAINRVADDYGFAYQNWIDAGRPTREESPQYV